jgi:hypothetical protein
VRVSDSEAKETCVAKGVSPFITKAGASPIPSPIIKACMSPFIMKAGASPIPNIERRALERNISVSYAPYKARSKLGQNNGGTRSAMFLPCSYHFFPFLEVPSKNLAVTN